MSEYVYVFANKWLPKLVKIGRTSDIVERLRQSAGASGAATFIPCPYECIYAIEVPDGKDSIIERTLHTYFDKNRIAGDKEFFEIKSDACIKEMDFLVSNVLKKAHKVSQKDIKLYNEQALGIASDASQNKKKRASNSNFAKLQIPVGSTLVFENGEGDTQCVTTDMNNKVQYKGQEYSVSALAQKLLNVTKPVNGYLWFSYNGKSLIEIREDLDKKGE